MKGEPSAAKDALAKKPCARHFCRSAWLCWTLDRCSIHVVYRNAFLGGRVQRSRDVYRASSEFGAGCVANTVDLLWRMPKAMWGRGQGLLPVRKRRKKIPDRRPVERRPVPDGIFYVLWTGCQWKAAPRNSVPAAVCTGTFSVWSNRASSPNCGVDFWTTSTFRASTGGP